MVWVAFEYLGVEVVLLEPYRLPLAGVVALEAGARDELLVTAIVVLQ
jgi:hypothetical protein